MADLRMEKSTFGSVWVVIPVHNRCEVTRRCLGHLQQQNIPSWATVLVVDDGSTDATSEMLRQEFPWVQVHSGDGNLWWGGCIRAGMATAIHHGAHCICWLNDDTLPDPHALEKLVQVAIDRGAIVGGISPTPASSGFTYAGGLIQRGWPITLTPLPPFNAGLAEVAWLHGNMVAVPEIVWQQIGLPEVTWAKQHFADICYTLQAHRAGRPVFLNSSATGVAAWNDSGSYLSWRDPQIPAKDLISGLYNPRMWWYLPGVAFFQMQFFGWRGCLRTFWLLFKSLLVYTFKCMSSLRSLRLF